MAPTVGPLLNWTKTVVSNSYPSKSLSVQCLGLPWPFGHPMDVGNRKQNHLGAVTTNQKGAELAGLIGTIEKRELKNLSPMYVCEYVYIVYIYIYTPLRSKGHTFKVSAISVEVAAKFTYT